MRYEQVKAGFLGFYPREDELYLSKFYLKRECRRQGIGRDMAFSWMTMSMDCRCKE